MQRKIITTADGSKTIHIPEWNEQYHSKHGAVQEALHVFVKSGLHNMLTCHSELDSESQKNKLSILEIGFGTGLNGYLTLLESIKLNLNINYVGVDAYPVNKDEINSLNYPEAIINKKKDELFDKIHELPWEKRHFVTDNFSLIKRKQLFREINDKSAFNLIYFDAFAARVQPEIWTEEIFSKMYKALLPKGVLVTYSAKGSVRRAMQAVGFTVERLPGPPGKREMLRAKKD